MRRIAVFFVALAALTLFLACPTNTTTGPLAGIGSTDGTLYIEGKASAAKAAESETATAGALMQMTMDGAERVTFYDDTGAEVVVTVRHARILSDGRLVLAITYNAEESCIVADPTTGTLTALSPEPEGWDYAREEAGAFWYAGAGAIWRLDLATLAAERQTAASEGVAGGVWFKRCAAGITATVPGSGLQTYYASPTAAGVSNAISLPDPATYLSFEAADGTVYSIHRTGADVVLRPYAETAMPGVFAAGADEALCTLPWTPATAALRLTSKKLTRELVAAWDYGILRIVADDSGIKYEVVELIGPDGFFGALETHAAAEGEDAYYAFHEAADSTKWHVWNLKASAPVARALAESGAAEILADTGISGLMPVGDRLYYVRDSGSGPETMVYAAPGPATVYASGAVSIEAVK